MRVDLAAYLALVEKYNSYLPYKHEDEHKNCQCVNIGKKFDIYAGKKTNKSIEWRILNWEDLPKSINPEGKDTATTLDLISLNALGCSPFIEDRNDLQKDLWKNSVICQNLNGEKNKKYSFIDHAFKEEEILLRGIEKQDNKKKTTLIIDTNSAYLKEDFIRSLRANPKVLNELVPAMRLLIKEAESLEK